MENSDNEDDGNLDNLEDLDEEQMEKLLQLQVRLKMCQGCPEIVSNHVLYTMFCKDIDQIKPPSGCVSIYQYLKGERCLR